MSKDAYWFKHDSNASRDLRLMQIKAIYGLEGLGIFWSLIEVLREQVNYRWEEKQSKILSKIIDCDEPKLNSFLTDCKRIGLLKFHSGFITSDRLIKDMKNWESKKKNRTKHERNNNENRTKDEDKRREEKIKEEEIKKKYDSFKISLLDQPTWSNEFCMKSNLMPNQLSMAIDNFISHCIAGGENHVTEKDFKNHFRNWCLKMNGKILETIKKEITPPKIGNDGKYIR